MNATSTSGPEGQRILVVDDEWSIRDLLTTALEFVGYEVRTATDGLEGLAVAAEFAPHLLLLDVNMPGVDGLEMCRRLRARGDSTPVVFLTARDSADDTVSGFAVGADDYLTKPFHLRVLTAHIAAVLRRSAPAIAATARLSCGPIEMDDTTHRVTRDGSAVELSPTEYRLLRYLLQNADVVVSKSQILDAVWQYDFGGDAGVVETYMSTLRRKVDSGADKVIQTVRGFGYAARSGSGR